MFSQGLIKFVDWILDWGTSIRNKYAPKVEEMIENTEDGWEKAKDKLEKLDNAALKLKEKRDELEDQISK